LNTAAETPFSKAASPPRYLVAGTQPSQSPNTPSSTLADLEVPVSAIGQQLSLVEDGLGISTQQCSGTPHSITSQPSLATCLGPPYPTDGLCSRELLKCMLDDYLEFLYPLIPVVHRPSFRQDLRQNRDVYDKDFLGLILSLCAATVGTMPRRFRAYRSFQTPIQFQTRTEMIRYCYDLSSELRGPDYFDRINLQKWATSYMMTISFFQIGEHNRSRMVEVESMQFARLLDLHRISGYDGLNCIETQLRKKAFWLMFYGYVYVYHKFKLRQIVTRA
jgi:hypothetical protein